MIKQILTILLLTAMTHNVFAGEKAAAILERYSFSSDEVAQLIDQYPEFATAEIASHREIQIDEDQFALNLYAEATNDVFVVHKSESSVAIEKVFMPFDVTTKTITGEIHGTLLETLKNDIDNDKIVQTVDEAFKDEFTTTKGLRVGASYSLDVIEYSHEGTFVKFGDVLRAKLVVGLAVSEKVLQQNLETLNWYLMSLVPPQNERPFYSPVKETGVSSLFNLARKHPVKRRIQPHNGIDFRGAPGTPIYPALDGVIIAMSRTRAKGKFILIQHDNGYQTTYDHLRKFSKGMHIGKRVELEEQIGEVGRTGYATGPHLHFGVMKDGFYVDPINLVKDYTYDQRDLFEPLEFEE